MWGFSYFLGLFQVIMANPVDGLSQKNPLRFGTADLAQGKHPSLSGLKGAFGGTSRTRTVMGECTGN